MTLLVRGLLLSATGMANATCMVSEVGWQAYEWRKFCKLKWYRIIMHVYDDERLPFKLIPNEWNKMNSKARPRKGWFAQVN